MLVFVVFVFYVEFSELVNSKFENDVLELSIISCICGVCIVVVVVYYGAWNVLVLFMESYVRSVKCRHVMIWNFRIS